jgi:hypothetical protein
MMNPEEEQANVAIAAVAATLPDDDQERFSQIAADELLALHEGNFARYRITPTEFADWQRLWQQK